MKISVCEWRGRVHCVYLNDYRVAGGKPWGGGETVAEWDVPIERLVGVITLGETRAILAVHAAINHWNEFGADNGFEERMAELEKLIKTDTNPKEPVVWRDT